MANAGPISGMVVTARRESYAALAADTGGDAILMQVALDGMSERRNENISAIFAPVALKGLRVLKGPGNSASAPVGRSGQKVNFPNPNAPKPRNAPETIGGRNYSGHALDRMQERGYTPSVVDNALRTGTRSAGNKPGTSVFTDRSNNLCVITNSNSGRVITVTPGGG